MAWHFACGAECEANGVGANAPSGTNKHWSTIDAAVTNVVMTVRTGSRSWRHNPSSAQAQLVHLITGTPNQFVARAYFRFATLPSADTGILGVVTASSITEGAGFKQSNSTITSFQGTTYGGSGISVTTGVWYCVEVVLNISANPHTVDVYVDGVAVVRQSPALASSTVSSFFVGINASTSADMFCDDISCATSQLTRIGPGAVYGLKPNVDGNHNIAGSPEFLYGPAGQGTIPDSATDVNAYLDAPLDTTITLGDYINQATAASGAYVEVGFENLPVTVRGSGYVNGMEIVAAHHAAGTGAARASLQWSDSAGSALIYNDIDWSETSIIVTSVGRVLDGGGVINISQSKIDEGKVRWGYSTDATPDVYCDGIRLEVDVPWFVAGQTATETETPLAGSIKVTMPGANVVETDSTYAGQAAANMRYGETAVETEIALKGGIVIGGSTVVETDTALRGALKIPGGGNIQVAGVGDSYNTGADQPTTSHVIDLPDGHQSGDLLLVTAMVDGAGGISWPGGWTELFEMQVDGSGSATLVVAYRTSDGTGTTVTMTSASEAATAKAYRITGWYGSGAPEYQTAVGTDAYPDPPSLTPSWGSAQSLWIATATMNGGTGGCDQWPYTDNQYVDGTGGSGSAGGSTCTQVITASSQNPQAFHYTNNSVAWAAANIAIRPGGGADAITVFGSLATETDQTYEGDVVEEGGGTIAGSTATETDTALAGGRVLPGSLTTENDQALVGTPAVALPGSSTTETDDPAVGTPHATVAGATATETDDPAVGTLLAALPGTTALEDDGAYTGSYLLGGGTTTETDSALGGSVAVVLAGALATESDTASAGIVDRAVSGSLASESDTALAGAPAASPQGALASETDEPYAGTPAVVVAGVLALESDDSYAGTVSGATTINGALATEQDGALAGSLLVALPGSSTTETDDVYLGTPHALVAGVLGLEDDTALVGTPHALIAGALASEQDSALAGTVSGATTINGALATEQDGALAGALATVLVGATTSEDDQALAGSPALGGSVALESDEALAGTPAVVVAGSLASESEDAYAGTYGSVVPGSSTQESDAALAGTPAVVRAGAVTTETDSAYAGTASSSGEVVVGATATETDVAYVGFARIVARIGTVAANNWVYVESAGKPGPFLDGNGNLYVLVGNEPVGDAYLVMLKSTNGGASWSEVGGASRPATLDTECCQVVQVGTALHVLHQGSDRDVYYHRFNTSDAPSNPDTWPETDTVVYNGDGTASDQQCTLVARSDGSLVAAYRTNVISSTGRLGYSIRSTGGSWGSTSVLDHNGGSSPVYARGVSAVVGEADKVHFFYAADVLGTDHIWHRSLPFGGSLSSEEAVSDNVTKVSSSYDQPLTQPTYYDDDGTERITIAWIRNSNNYLVSARVEDDGTPTAEVALGTAALAQSFDGHNIAAQLVADPLNKVVYAFYADSSTRDLWVSTSTDGGAWTTPVELLDARGIQWFDGLQVYTRNGRRRIGMFWSEGTVYQDDETLWFSEYALPIIEAGVVEGHLATENDQALAGSLRVTLTGSTVTETDTALAGSIDRALPGSTAQEADQALAGTPHAVVAGATASELETALSGSIDRALPGELATELELALGGAPLLGIIGALATELELALGGAPTVTLTGSSTTESDAALGGATVLALAGVTATEQDEALGGGRVLPGATAVESDDALVGTNTFGAVGTTALESDEALAGSVDAVLAGGTCQETDEALPGVAFMAFEAEPAEVTVEALDAEVALLVHAEAAVAEVVLEAGDAEVALGTLAVAALPATVTTDCRDAFVVLRPVERHEPEAEPAIITVLASDAVAAIGATATPAEVTVTALDAHVEQIVNITAPVAAPALVAVLAWDAEVTTPDLWPIERMPRDRAVRARGGRARVLEVAQARARGGRVMVTAGGGEHYREGP